MESDFFGHFSNFWRPTERNSKARPNLISDRKADFQRKPVGTAVSTFPKIALLNTVSGVATQILVILVSDRSPVGH